MIRWAASWTLYWLGDAVSRVSVDPIAGMLYRPYQNLMRWSATIQGGGKGPWRATEDSVEEE